MQIPGSIEGLLNERIRFCHTVLIGKEQIPDSPQKDEMVSTFQRSLDNLKEMLKLFHQIREGQSPLKARFKVPVMALISDMKRCAIEQATGTDLATLHGSCDLIAGLDRISDEVDAL